MKKQSLEAKLRRRYTKATVRDADNSYRQYTVWLKAGVQTFIVNRVPIETKQEAEWFRTQLAKALATIVTENK